MLAQSGDGRTLARATRRPARRRRDRRSARDRAAAGVAQPADPAGAGRPADRRRRWCCSTNAGAGGRSGMLAGDLATADAPFTGPLYYLRRALDAVSPRCARAISQRCCRARCSVLVLADRPLPAGAERDALAKWVEQGRPADPLRRPAHRRAADRRDRSADAGEAAGRRPPARRRAVLEPSRPGWRRSRQLAVRRPGRAGRGEGERGRCWRSPRRPRRPDLGARWPTARRW